METVMVFAPHPDDDIIGCGGSIARHVQQGKPVSIVYMSSGEAGSLQHKSEDLARLREGEATAAAHSLGVTDLTFLHFPDGYLEFNKESLGCIVTLLRAKKPSLIYLPHSQDAVPDHQITNRLVLEGCRRAAGPWFPEYGKEVWQIKTVFGYEIWTPLQSVGYSENISSFMSDKLAALRMHKSQIDGIAYDQAIQGLNRYRGIMTGKGDYCECFQLIQAQI
ncbi:MAG: PIG-L deacetylase family protein [Syntrophomonas sp.]|jgi:LmbE family N-acetylglucosaminyl deacetylase